MLIMAREGSSIFDTAKKIEWLLKISTILYPIGHLILDDIVVSMWDNIKLIQI